MKGFTILRVLGILLGGVSLVLLSRPAFGLQFKVVFEGWLDVLGDSLSRFFAPLEYHVVVPVIDWLRSFHLDIPHPAKYWHHAFVLLWLLHSSVARNFTRGLGWGPLLILMLWAGLTALVAGAMSGTMPLDSRAILYWPLAGVMAFGTGFGLLGVSLLGAPWWPSLLFAALAALLAYQGLADARPTTSIFGIAVASPGLLELAAVVGCMGACLLLPAN